MSELFDTNEPVISKNKYTKDKFIADRIRWYIYSLFFIAFIIKFYHWPGGGVINVAVGGFAIILIMGTIIEGIIRKNIGKAFLDIAFATLLIYVIFRLQYWYGASYILFTAMIFFLVGFIFHKKVGERLNRKVYILIFLIFCSIGLMKTPNSALFYSTGLTKTFHSNAHSYAYKAWDRYSFLLDFERKIDTAMEANKTALRIANNENDTNFVNLLKQHRQIIISHRLQNREN